jgi:hypothetical protein
LTLIAVTDAWTPPDVMFSLAAVTDEKTMESVSSRVMLDRLSIVCYVQNVDEMDGLFQLPIKSIYLPETNLCLVQ